METLGDFHKEILSQGSCKKEEIGGWIYLSISGDAYTRGFQHGYFLAEEIQRTIELFKFNLYWSTGEDIDFFSKIADQLYSPWIGEFKEEIQGISDGVRQKGIDISYTEILAWNASIELLGNYWPIIANSISSNLPSKPSCNSFISVGTASYQREIVLGHTTWDTFIDSTASRLVLDISPSNGYRIIMQSSPGFIHSGTDFFICSSGLMGSETSIPGFINYDKDKAPEFYRVRQAMQYARSIQEWVDIMLLNNNGGYANSWLLGDINNNEIARFELGLKNFGLEVKKDGYFWGCNVPVNQKILNQECQGISYSNIMQSAGRRIRWEEMLKQATTNGKKIDLNSGMAMLSDHYDEWLKKENPSSRSICGHFDEEPSEFAPLGFGPNYPYGANDLKITNSSLAREMKFLGRYGRPCGKNFDKETFLKKYRQYEWQREFLESKPENAPFVEFPV